MIDAERLAYVERREQEERQRSAQSLNPEARRAHIAMAIEYARHAEIVRSGGTPALYLSK